MFIANNSFPYKETPLKKPFFAAGPEPSPKDLLQMQKDVNGAYFTWRKEVDRNKSGTDIDALNIEFRQIASDLLTRIKPTHYQPYQAPQIITPRRPASPGVRNGAGSKRENAFNFTYPENVRFYFTKNPDTKTILRVQQGVAGFMKRSPKFPPQTEDVLEKQAVNHGAATSQSKRIYSYLVAKAKDESQVHRDLPPLKDLPPHPAEEKTTTPSKKRKRGAKASEADALRAKRRKSPVKETSQETPFRFSLSKR